MLRAERDSIIHYFRQIGQEVVIDEAEGYAFLRQIESEENERSASHREQPTTGYRRNAVACVPTRGARTIRCTAEASTRLVLTRYQMREMVGQFLRETNDETRDIKAIDTAIRRVSRRCGFVRPLGSADGDTYEVMRILRRVSAPGNSRKSNNV